MMLSISSILFIVQSDFFFQGIRALHSPHTGIVDYRVVTESYADNFTRMGGEIIHSFQVKEFKESDNPEYPIAIHGVSSVSIKKL